MFQKEVSCRDRMATKVPKSGLSQSTRFRYTDIEIYCRLILSSVVRSVKWKVSMSNRWNTWLISRIINSYQRKNSYKTGATNSQVRTTYSKHGVSTRPNQPVAYSQNPKGWSKSPKQDYKYANSGYNFLIESVYETVYENVPSEDYYFSSYL